MRRTIICLAAKRSGTTAVQQVFSKHPEVKLCHIDQDIKQWEANFWNYAAAVIDNDYSQLENINREKSFTPREQFEDRMRNILPGVKIPSPISVGDVFTLWDTVLDSYGPIVFDKSPKYLGSKKGLELLYEYIKRGNDVRIFSLVRDPRDVIASQYELWNEINQEMIPEAREQLWIEYYENLENYKTRIGEENIPVINYEKLSSDPDKWFKYLCKYCGIKYIPAIIDHIKPVSIGRYYTSKNKKITQWKPGEKLKYTARKYGYDINNDRYWMKRRLLQFKNYISIRIQYIKRKYTAF